MPQHTGKIPDETGNLQFYGDTQSIRRIYYSFTSLILVGLCAGFIILASHGDWIQVYVLLGCIPFVLSSFFFISRHRYETASIFLAIVLFTLITFISTLGLGIHAVSNMGLPAILILAAMVIRKRTLIFLFLYLTGCIAWLVFGEIYEVYQPTVLVKSVNGDFFTVLIVLLTTGIMVRVLTESLYQSRREVQRELNERKRAEERLEYDALHDTLTGLPNRSLFFDRLGQKVEHTRRHPESLFAVLYLDLDRFKVINDSLGHAVGDEVLVETANRLKACLRPEDTVARLSGDEFAILLDDFQDISDAVHVAERIQSRLAESSMIKEYNRVTTASVGITIYNDRFQDPHEILRDADSAMYRAKAMGGGHYAIFDDTMHASAMALLQMETDLKQAQENREWQVYYQPIVSVSDRSITGVEALVRWRHPKRGLIRPTEFIHVAEETGLIQSLGEYVLREACSQVKRWRDTKIPNLSVSVNFSGRQFQSQDLPDVIMRVLEETGLESEALHVEITESVAMKDLSFSHKVLNRLESMGLAICLDDFGSGYSSLGYLNLFPVNFLKIDQAFFSDRDGNISSDTIINAIVSMAHALNLEVITECVETEVQYAFLESIACDKIQGNLICPAIPANQLEKRL